MNDTDNPFRVLHAKGIYDSKKKDYTANAIVLQDAIIVAVGNFEALCRQYPTAQQIDYSKFYLLPGLINTHVHLEFEPVEDTRKSYLEENAYLNFLRAAQNAHEMLLSGVTTVRDAGSSWNLLHLNDSKANALCALPRMRMAGPPITITGGHLHFMQGEADSLDEVVKAVREHHKRGCTDIKIMVSGGQMTPGSVPERESYHVDAIRAITEEASVFGMPTFAHCLTTKGFVNAMHGGVQCIEHCACFVRNQKNGLLERVYEPDIMMEFKGKNPYFMNAISNNYHALDHCRNHTAQQTPREAFLLEQEERECEIFKNYIKLGMIPVIGTDAGCGLTYFDETWLECEILAQRCGFSSSDIITAATINGARCLEMEDTIGQLAPGYSADMIALSEDPLQDITALHKVVHVFCKGQQVR